MSSSSIRPFVAGVASAYLSVLLINQFRSARSRKAPGPKQQQQQQPPPPPPPSGLRQSAENDSSRNKLMDSSSLDQRMIRKAEGAIRFRTSRLIIVIERCTNDHNYSAILRTAEALGVQNIYVINPPTESSLKGDVEFEQENEMQRLSSDGDKRTQLVAIGKGSKVVKNASDGEVKDRAMHHLFARKATEWLDVREFDNTTSCLAALKEDGYQIWATDLSQEAVCLDEKDLALAAQDVDSNTKGGSNTKVIPDKLAIVFGTEAVGCTAEMLNGADLRVYLPLRGFADSLNLSVATALVVHHLFVLDPTLIGAMTEDERIALRKKWYAKLARQRLLSSGKKRERSRLAGRVRSAEEYERKASAGEKLDSNQKKKVAQLAQTKAELEKLDQDLDERAERAVVDLLRNPPEPLTDMRRADEHRVTFVGKGTKKRNDDAWKDMAATANAQSIHGSSSNYFREKANASK